jgi:toxin ParE1/3/4
MPRFTISEKAVEDINGIWVYTAENFESARDFGQIRKGYRYSKVKSHLVFFRKTKAEEIEVVRVLHEIIDIEKQLTG